MDFLELLAVKDEEVLTGTYYEKVPRNMAKNIEIKGITFQYDIVNEIDKTHAKVLDALESEMSTQTIKTNDADGFKIKGHIATQEGGFWQITGINKRLVKPENKQALRILKQTIETEYIIRLIEVENPWGLK